MANPIHKLVGSLLRHNPPATVEEVTDLLVTPNGLRATDCVVDEWLNIARRANGIPSLSAATGRKWRTKMEERRRRPCVTPPKKRTHSYLQRLARRITRFFRRH